MTSLFPPKKAGMRERMRSRHQGQNFVRRCARRGPSPLPLIRGGPARPAGSSIIENTAGSKARASAIWGRKRKKVLYGATRLVYHYQSSDLKAVGVISGRCNFASSPVGLDWIDLRLRARSLPLGANAR